MPDSLTYQVNLKREKGGAESRAMRSAEIRRHNMLRLIEQVGSMAAISRKTGIAETYLSNIKAQVKNMGAKTARRLERAYGLDEGSMDVIDDSVIPAEVRADYSLLPDEDKALVDVFVARLAAKYR